MEPDIARLSEVVAKWAATARPLISAALCCRQGRIMDYGLFLPIANNGWITSSTSPQYMPTFDLNKQIVQKGEKYGFKFALSMIKLRWLRRAYRAGTRQSHELRV